MSEPTTEAGKAAVGAVREVVIHGVRDRFEGGYALAWHVSEKVAEAEAEARQQGAAAVLALAKWVPMVSEDDDEPFELLVLDPSALLLGEPSADPEPTDDREAAIRARHNVLFAEPLSRMEAVSCLEDGEDWPCDTDRALALLDAARAERDAARAERDWEAVRMERGWPTPNHMRRTADALDVFTRPAKYGDVLRWVADACDVALAAHRGSAAVEVKP